MNDSEWISKLKAGDKVIVSSGYGYNQQIQTVTKITPSGLIKVGETIFTQYGSERTSSRWNKSYLREATEESMNKILRDDNVAKALRLMRKIKDITYEQSVEILKILDTEDTK